MGLSVGEDRCRGQMSRCHCTAEVGTTVIITSLLIASSLIAPRSHSVGQRDLQCFYVVRGALNKRLRFCDHEDWFRLGSDAV
jgi:hypothetical protein